MNMNFKYTVSQSFLNSGLSILKFIPFKWAKKEVEVTKKSLEYMMENNIKELEYRIEFSCKGFRPLLGLAPVILEIWGVINVNKELVGNCLFSFLRGIKFNMITNDPDGFDAKHPGNITFDGSTDPRIN